MAFGGLKGTLTGNGNSVGTSNSLTGSVSVAVGDLVLVCFGQQTNRTATGASSSLVTSYSAQNAGTDAGVATGRFFYGVVTTAGTLTSVAVAAASSTNDYCGLAAVIEGPFTSSPLDANPANITSDVTSPFTCPASGTLAQSLELVVGWGAANQSTTWAATSPNLLAGNANNSTTIKVAIGYQAVTSTSTVSPAFTAAANPTACVLGTCSFKKGAIADSVTETASATDTPSGVKTTTVSASEAASAADTPSAVKRLSASGSEAASATDGETSALQYATTTTESVSAAETSTSNRTAVATKSEAASATDTPDSVRTTAGAITETATGLDTVSGVRTTAATATETGTASDTSGGIRTAAAAGSEAASALDTPGGSVLRSAVANEAASAAETSDASVSGGGPPPAGSSTETAPKGVLHPGRLKVIST